ncbi:unnamed protein product [Symbiodinium microadriaticum]|nr:unnamed protein product [Symbiodinium microadriaticum]
MSKAFDMVDRRRLREALELAAADPFLIELVGKLHIQALYEMTASDQAFSIATKRGIKQGCKLAPSRFAFATCLLFQKLGEHCDTAVLARILTMYADDTLLQMHFDDLAQLHEALRMGDLLLDQLTELGFKVNPEKSALLLQLHGGSAQQIRHKLILTKAGEKIVQLPSGRLIALKTQVPYLGIIISYREYEMQSLRHRLQASKAVMKEVAHAVRNSHAVTEKRRMSIWHITAWASAFYGLHVVGLTEQGLPAIESHMLYQLRFVLRSYSQNTRESNQSLLKRKGMKTARVQIMARLRKFIKRQHKGDKDALLPHYIPASGAKIGRDQQDNDQKTELDKVHTEALAGNKAVKQHLNRQHPEVMSRVLQEAQKQALDLTPRWTFAGRQQDAAEFLTAILPNFSPLSLGAWETDAGYIVDEEGTVELPLYAGADSSIEWVPFQLRRGEAPGNSGGDSPQKRQKGESSEELLPRALSLQPCFVTQALLQSTVRNMAYVLQPTQLVTVLIPVLAALFYETEVEAGREVLPGSIITQIQTLIQGKAVKLKAQLMMLAVELLPAEQLKKLNSFCSRLRGYDYFALSKLRDGTELGWSSLTGFQCDLEAARRETEIMSHTSQLLPTNLRHQYELETELLRQKYFREDQEFNAAVAAWESRLGSLLNEEWLGSHGHRGGTPGGVTSSECSFHEEDLLAKLGQAKEYPGQWYRFPFRAPNKLDLSDDKAETGYHGKHLECLHSILASGRLLPSDPGIAGTRAFENRGGVDLHRPMNWHLAEGCSSLTRYGTKHIFIKPCIEVRFDPKGNMRAGKQTNQLIQTFETVKILAVHLRIATKANLQVSEYLMEWAGALDLPLSSAKQAFETLGLADTLPKKTEVASQSSGDTPLTAGQGGVTPPAEAGSSSQYATHSSSAATSSMDVDMQGGDLLEIGRGNTKQRYQLGLKSDGYSLILFFTERPGIAMNQCSSAAYCQVCINSCQSVRTKELYDRDGELIPRRDQSGKRAITAPAVLRDGELQATDCHELGYVLAVPRKGTMESAFVQGLGKSDFEVTAVTVTDRAGQLLCSHPLADTAVGEAKTKIRRATGRR